VGGGGELSVRGLSAPSELLAGGVVTADFVLWVLLVLMVTAALFVAVQMAVKGSSLLRDLRGALTGRLPPGVATALALAILFGPLALPGGLLWALLLWSALLWGYQSLSERIVTGLVWVIVAIAPVVAAGQQVRIALEQSPPLRALASFGEGRLYGTFFSDLQVLRSVLGTDAAALELLGDVHRTLGQWEVARTHYRQVLEAEPDNVAVLINFGAYSFRKGNFALATSTSSARPGSAPFGRGLLQPQPQLLGLLPVRGVDQGARRRQADRRRARRQLGPDAEPRPGADVQRLALARRRDSREAPLRLARRAGGGRLAG